MFTLRTILMLPVLPWATLCWAEGPAVPTQAAIELVQAPGNEGLRVMISGDRITALYGVPFYDWEPARHSDTDSFVEAFLTDHADALGVDDVVLAPYGACSGRPQAKCSMDADCDPGETCVSKINIRNDKFTVYTYRQTIDGLPVHGSVVKIPVLLGAEKKIGYVGAWLVQPPEESLPEDGPLFGAEEAHGVVSAKYPGLTFWALDNPQAGAEKVVFEAKNATVHRTWRFGGSGADESYLFFVDTNSREIVGVIDLVRDFEVEGTVKGYATPGWVGDNPPGADYPPDSDYPGNPDANPGDPDTYPVLFDLPAVKVQAVNADQEVVAEAWTTDSAGSWRYSLANLSEPVVIRTILEGPWAAVSTSPWYSERCDGNTEEECQTDSDCTGQGGQEKCLLDLVVWSDPDCPNNCTDFISATPQNDVNLVFNPADDDPPPEPEFADWPSHYDTAQVNAFLKVSATHDWFHALQPSCTLIDQQSEVWVNFINSSEDPGICCNAKYNCGSEPPRLSFLIPSPSGAYAGFCNNSAFSTVIAHEYGHFILDELILGFIDNDTDRFHEGVADGVASLMHNTPCMFRHWIRTDDFECRRNIDEIFRQNTACFFYAEGTEWCRHVHHEPVGEDVQAYACTEDEQFGCEVQLDDPRCYVQEFLPWLNCHATALSGAFWDLRALVLDVDPGLIEPDKPTEELFADFLFVTDARLDESALVEVLVADDDDADLTNGSDHACQIYCAFMGEENGAACAPDGYKPGEDCTCGLIGHGWQCPLTQDDGSVKVTWEGVDGVPAEGPEDDYVVYYETNPPTVTLMTTKKGVQAPSCWNVTRYFDGVCTVGDDVEPCNGPEDCPAQGCTAPQCFVDGSLTGSLCDPNVQCAGGGTCVSDGMGGYVCDGGDDAGEECNPHEQCPPQGTCQCPCSKKQCIDGEWKGPPCDDASDCEGDATCDEVAVVALDLGAVLTDWDDLGDNNIMVRVGPEDEEPCGDANLVRIDAQSMNHWSGIELKLRGSLNGAAVCQANSGGDGGLISGNVFNTARRIIAAGIGEGENADGTELYAHALDSVTVGTISSGATLRAHEVSNSLTVNGESDGTIDVGTIWDLKVVVVKGAGDSQGNITIEAFEEGSELRIGGNMLGDIDIGVPGSAVTPAIAIAGDLAGNLTAAGSISGAAADHAIVVGGELSGSITTGGDISLNGGINVCTDAECTGGISENGVITVGGSLAAPITVHGDMAGSIVVHGDVNGPILITGSVTGDVPGTGRIIIKGNLNSSIEIVGGLLSTETDAGLIQIEGDANGPIHLHGAVSGTIEVYGTINEDFPIIIDGLFSGDVCNRNITPADPLSDSSYIQFNGGIEPGVARVCLLELECNDATDCNDALPCAEPACTDFWCEYDTGNCANHPPMAARGHHGAPKNRYISFEPTVSENPPAVAFKVTLTSLSLKSCNSDGSPDVEGWRCRTDDDCRACSSSGNACWTAELHCDAEGGETCDLTGAQCVNDQANSVDRAWWVAVATAGECSGEGSQCYHAGECPPGTCSESTQTSCHYDEGCPAGESCENAESCLLARECSGSGDPCQNANDCPSGESCVLSGPFRLVPAAQDAQYHDDWPSPVHVGDCEIVPVATYGVQRIVHGTPEEDPASYSTLLAVDTCAKPAQARHWGDAVGPLLPGGWWQDPDGFTNFQDVSAAVFAFQKLPGHPGPEVMRVDVHGNEYGDASVDPPNEIVNFCDIQNLLRAFEGYPYPYSDPANCPIEYTFVALTGDPGVFTLVPSSGLIQPGEPVEVDVFVSSVDKLAGYEVAIEVTGGAAGELILTGITIDAEHEDFAFGEESSLTATDLTGLRLGAAVLEEEGVDVTGPAYLGTFSFVASGGATGEFQIAVRGGTASFLNDPQVRAMASQPGDCAVIGSGIDCFNDAPCDDSNECTTDTCVSHECTHDDVASGTSCDDGLWCTVGEKCDGNGNCAGGGSRCKPGELCLEISHECEELPELP